MKRILAVTLLFLAVFCINNANGQAGVLNPNDPDVIFTSTNQPPVPTFNRISKWGHTNRLSWNPFSKGYKSYYFKGMAFRVKFPKTYSHNTVDGKVYPSIFFFHGLGEPGPIWDNEFHLVHGGQLHSQKVDDGTFDGFMIYPQSQSGYLQSYFPVIKDLVDSMVKYVKLDIDRIHVGGLSSGGQATWDFPQQEQYAKLACAIEPISAAQYEDVNFFNRHITIPIFVGNGGQDRGPYATTVTDIINSYKNLGGNITQAFFPTQGHGAWNSFWADSRYWPFINGQHKANPLVYFQRNKFCPNEPVNATLGLQAGFSAYEWEKDGVTIIGQTTNKLTVNSYGTYRGRFKRTPNSAWSQWSPTPVVVSENQGTVSPNIQINGLFSNVLPAPDGNTLTPLMVPNNYFTYEWRRVGDDAIVSTSHTYNAPIGQYKVKVTEQFGCGSEFSSIYTVIPSNGPNKPDAASSLSAIAISNNSILLNWNDNPNPSNNETAFEIYRSNSSGNAYILIGRTVADSLSYLDEGLSANTKYFYIIRAVNASSASALSSEVFATTQSDVTAPSTPGNLRTTGITRGSVGLAWDASTDDVALMKYEIYINGSKSYVTTNTSFTVNNLASLQTYSFYVKAVDASGNASPASNQVSVFSPFLTGLNYKYYEGNWSTLPNFSSLTPRATGVSQSPTLAPRKKSNRFGFLWEGFIRIPVTGTYKFETNSDDGSKLYIGTYSHTATALVDNDGSKIFPARREGTITLTAGIHPIAITYFSATAGLTLEVSWTCAEAGIPTRTTIPESAFSDIRAVDPNLLPAKPSNLLATGTAYNRIQLSWTDNSNNETAFEVSRSTLLTGTYVNIGTAPENATSFEDSIGLQANTKYWYKLRAINQFGQSETVSILESKWSFDNNYNDASGNNRNLTGSSSPTFNANDKKEGSHSISLNGSNQYLNLPSGNYPSNTSLTTRTIGLWIKPNANSISGTNKVVYDFGGSDNGMALRFNAGSLQGGIASGNTRFSVVVNSITTNSNWISNGWNHIALVYNVNQLEMYLNAVLIGSQSLTFNSVGSSTNASRIGASNSSNAFNSSSSSTNVGGLLDDFVIFKEPLNAAGINALMKESYPADTTLQLPATPDLPTNLVAVATTTTSISLQFDDNSTNENKFEIYRAVSNVNSFRLLATVNGGEGSIKNYIDSNLFSNTNYYYKVRAIGVGGITEFTPNLSVRTSNNNPLLSDVENFTMRYAFEKSIAVTATDADGETLSFSFVNTLPGFVNFISNTNGVGTLQLNPSISDQGSYSVSLVVNDTNGGADTVLINFIVNDNFTPVIATLNNVSVAESTTSSINLSASDQDGNSSLVWTIASAPSFVSITDNGNGSAMLSITPGYSHAGVYPITVVVNDGAGANVTTTFNLSVTNVEPPAEKWFISTKWRSANAPAPWNNVAATNTNNLLNGNGTSTSVGIQFLNTNWNAGDAGAVTGNNSGVYPDAVIKDYFWFGVYGAPNTVDFNIKGLTLGAKYNVTLFGSSAWRALGNNGTTIYSINGNAKPLYVDMNQQNTVTFAAIAPDSLGNIKVNMSKGNATPYGVLNAVVIEKPFDDGSIPLPPTNLIGTALSNGTVKLDWNDVAYNESRYLVYRATNPDGPFIIVNPSASNANDISYIDNTVLSSTTYFYKLVASNDARVSDFSNTVTVTTTNKAPVLNTIADVYVKSENTLTLGVTATDDVNDILTTTVTGLPTFAVFQSTGNGTGNIVFNPTVSDLGPYTGIVVTVTDNFGASASRTFNLTVTDNSVRSVYLNFGPAESTPQAAPWNNFLGYPYANYSYNGIKDDQNVMTGFSFKLLSQWNGGLTIGMRTGDNKGVFPDNVMKTSFHNYNNGNHIIEFNGLNPQKLYSIGFLTNTNSGVQSLVTFTSGSQTVNIDGKYNTNQLANLNGLVPNASGTIQVSITKIAANLVLCLNAVVIREYDPSDPVLKPADLMAETILQTDKMKLTWSDRSNNETGFEVWRSTASDGSFVLVGTTAPNTTTFIDSALQPNTRYFYKVRSVDGSVLSNFSNLGSALTAFGIVLINQNVNVAQQAPSPWNSTSSPSTQGATFSNLITTTLQNSGYEMVITKEFNGAGFAGVNANGVFPANVMFTNYWTDAGQTSQVRFQNLDLSKKYRIGCFGSNTNSNYTTANYTCNGKTVELNSYFNDSKVVYLDKLSPGSNGELVVNVNTAGGSPFSFTGAFTIEFYDDNTADGPVVNTIYTEGAPELLLTRVNNDTLTRVVETATTENETKKASELSNMPNNVIKVFPNPFTDKIQVELENPKSETVAIIVYDLNGKMVFRSNSFNVMKGKNIVAASLPIGMSLAPGTYVINVWIDGKVSKTVKLIKVN